MDLDFAELERILPVVRLPPSIQQQPWPPCFYDKSEEEVAWEAIIGTSLDNWRNAEFTESNIAILEYLMENDAKCKLYNDECYKQTEEANATLGGQDKLYHIDVWHRCPTPSCFYFWYKCYQMSNTSPTSLRSKRFTQPCAYEYDATPLLQFFSLSFAGKFLCSKSMSVYGFLAIRDDIDYLRNYVFCRSREDAYVIRPDSPDLPLISPVRGMSSLAPVIVEYSIKVKNNDMDDNGAGDSEIIDGCFRYVPGNPYCNQKVKPRIYGPFGPMDMRFMYISTAVEATIDVKVKWAAKGYNLKAVSAFTSRQHHRVLLYDGASLVTPNDGPSACVVVASYVVAVELGGELKLVVDISIEDNLAGERHRYEHTTEAKQAVQTHELFFTAQKYRSSKGAIIMKDKFHLVAKITWSTVDN